LSLVDIILVVIFLVGAISGYREGFLMELFSLLALLLGVLGAFKLLGWAMVLLGDKFNIDQKMLPYIAFAAVFIAIVIVVRLVGNLIKVSLDKSFLGRVDQIAGAFLGLIKTAFILSVLLWLTDSLKIGIPEKWTDNSWILPRLATFAPTVASWLSEIFPVFKDVF
jgi:membrane protein required for colicin V production